MNKQIALITGATSGIGFALAKIFAQNNFDLLLVARKQDELNRVAADLEKQYSIKTTVFSQDLAQPDAAQNVFDFCTNQNLQINTLVNNAGFGAYGQFDRQDLNKQVGMVELNVRTLTTLCRLFIPEMKKQGGGKILNIASTAAFQPGPFFAVYYATKAYVVSLSEALHSELKDTDIHVTCLCPGPTSTEFFGKETEVTKTNLIKRGRMMTADAVAKIGYNALMANKSLVVAGFMNSIMAKVAQISPRSIVTAVSRWTLQPSKE